MSEKQPRKKRTSAKVEYPPSFDPDAFLRGIEYQYRELGEKYKEVVGTDSWEDANRVLDTIKDKAKAYKSASTEKEKVAIATSMKKLGVSFGGPISKNLQKEAEGVAILAEMGLSDEFEVRKPEKETAGIAGADNVNANVGEATDASGRLKTFVAFKDADPEKRIGQISKKQKVVNAGDTLEQTEIAKAVSQPLDVDLSEAAPATLDIDLSEAETTSAEESTNGFRDTLREMRQKFKHVYPKLLDAPEDIANTYGELYEKMSNNIKSGDTAGLNATREEIEKFITELPEAAKAKAKEALPESIIHSRRGVPKKKKEEPKIPVLEEVVQPGEGTALEKKKMADRAREKLRGLIEGAAKKMKEEVSSMGERSEQMKGYLAERSKSLQEKAKEYGANPEQLVRTIGETYNKLGWKAKLAVGAGLGLGAAVFTGVSTPLTLVFGGLLGVQRIAGMASMYMKFEKHLQDTVVGESKGLLGRQEWYQNLFMGSSEKQRKIAAAVMAVGYTAGMSAAIGEAVKLGSESAAGEAVHEWLKHHYPFGEAGVSATGAGAGEAAPAPAPAPVAPEMHQPAAGYHTNVAELRQMDVALEPKIPSVDIQATPGHGYEWMLKRMWENLHENHAILPKGIDPHSDLGELLKIQPGDKAGIDKLVHDMALKHSFFNQAGETSVQIDPSAHMTIGAGGQLHLADAVHGDMVRAVENMHTTPAYQPEAPTTSAEVLEQQRQEILDRLANQTNAGHTVAEQAPSITAETTEPLTQPPSPVVERGIITNQFDLNIPIAEPHIYASPDGERLYVYGGSLKEQMNKVLAFLIAHQDKIVYTPDAEGAHRIPWHFINGEIEPAGPLEKSSGFLGFGRAFIKEPPGPNDLAKIIE